MYRVSRSGQSVDSTVSTLFVLYRMLAQTGEFGMSNVSNDRDWNDNELSKLCRFYKLNVCIHLGHSERRRNSE